MAARVFHLALPRCPTCRQPNFSKEFADLKSSLIDHESIGRNNSKLRRCLYLNGSNSLHKFGHHLGRSFTLWKSPHARNRILFEPNEVPDDGIILLPPEDSRARHITTVLRPPWRGRLKIGIVDGSPGTALVEGDVKDGTLVGPSVRLQVTEWESPPIASRLSLLLAMPRPKAMRRLWSILGQLGLARILITNAARVERFYFDSQTLSPIAIRNELLLGLEQAADTRLPSVTVHKRLKPLLEQICNCDSQGSGSHGDRVECMDESEQEEGNINLSFCNTVLLLAHPGSPCNITQALEDAEMSESLEQDSGDEAHKSESSMAFCPRNRPRSSLKVLLAVGPEGGWTPFELTMFEEFGFRAVGLGSRPLRTDVYCTRLPIGVGPGKKHKSQPTWS